MAQRILWNINETVIMLDALIAVQEGMMVRSEAITSVSSALRARAVKNGFEVDETFRNINGITLQMSKMEYILTEGKRGMKNSSMSKPFHEAIDLYRNHRKTYEKILKEAKGMPDAKQLRDIYCAWLASQVSPSQLSESYVAYADIEDFCLNRKIIKKKLFELTSLEDIHKVVVTVNSNKVFCYTYKRRLSKMRSAMHFYYKFAKENPELLMHSISTREEVKSEAVTTKIKEPVITAIQPEEKKVEPAKTNAEQIVDFTVNASFVLTRPTEFFYFEEKNVKVDSWVELYVQIVVCFLEDYSDILSTYINRNIDGQRRPDFADKFGVDSMIVPRKIADNFYLETNISATDILRKIKRLLDLCNVDYENLVIHYQKKEHSEADINLIQQTKDHTKGNANISQRRKQFITWMKQSGVSVGGMINYLYAIRQSSKAASEHKICDTDLLLVQDANTLTEIKASLLNIPAFRDIDAKQNNCFQTALTKLAEFCSATYNRSQPIVKVSVMNVNEPNSTSAFFSKKICSCYAEILSEYFGEDGYQLGRAIFRGRFKQYYADKFGNEPVESDENIDEILLMVGTKRGDRIFPKQDVCQNNLVSKIIADIMLAFQMGATAVYIEAVFEKYQMVLADDLKIYNKDVLGALLVSQANGRYVQKNSVLVTEQTEVDSAADLLRIMKRFHQPQNYAVIHEKAWFIPYKKMKSLLRAEESIVNVASETYFYAPNLPISTDELIQLTGQIQEVLNDDSYITDARLMRLIKEKCPSIAINTEEYTTYGLRNCLGYILRNQFAFNGAIISLKGKKLNMSDVYAEFSRDHEALQLDDLINFSTEMNVGIYWDAVLGEMIRVSETEFVRKDLINFDVDAIDSVLEEICQENYIPIKDVVLFLYFPNVGYPWNNYLLESYLFSSSRKFKLLHSSFSKTGVYGAMVRMDSDICDYRSLLLDVLSKSNALSSPKMALQYIVDQGYQQRRRYEGIEMLIQEAKLKKEQREH